MQTKPRLWRASTQAANLHDQLTGIEAEARQPENPAADLADIFFGPLGVTLCKCRIPVRVEYPQIATMKKCDAGRPEGHGRQAVQQSMSNRRRALVEPPMIATLGDGRPCN